MIAIDREGLFMNHEYKEEDDDRERLRAYRILVKAFLFSSRVH